MTMNHSNLALDNPAMLIEMKRPGVVNENDWQSESRGAATTVLQKELRAYVSLSR
jgi:hypothetical protein